MVGDLYLSNAVIFDVPQKISILKGEKFAIKMDTEVGAKNWTANFDGVLSMKEGAQEASFEALEAGVSNVLILNDEGTAVLKRFDISVFNTEASTLGIEFSTKPRKTSV